MLLLISPAKTLDFSKTKVKQHSLPQLLERTLPLVDAMKKKSVKKIQKLMSVSESIATLNYDRYKTFNVPFDTTNAKQAILAFKGDVYLGLNATDFNAHELKFAQKHLRILSGLYGVLKPLDLMQPYRLEMGTKLTMGRKKNLYQYWGNNITQLINNDIEECGHKAIINLASNEYFKSIQTKDLTAPLVTVNFKEFRNGEFKFISFSAKKARGMMCHYIIKNKIKKTEDLLGFDYEGYAFNEDLSSDSSLIFTK